MTDIESFLTIDSNLKYNSLRDNMITLVNTNDYVCLESIIDQMIIAYTKYIDIKPGTVLIDDLREILIDFDKNINKASNSKFQLDVKSMNQSISLKMSVNNNIITVNFLSNDLDVDSVIISVIMHAINTFCYMFPHNYNGLTINVSLDDNVRILEYPENLTDLDSIYNWLKTRSTAFNVSGVTSRYEKSIILTRKQEVIKLLFHELAHYAEIDYPLIMMTNNYNWAITNSQLNLSEAYTEFISVVLSTAYITLHITTNNNYKSLFKQLYALEIQYSVYLSAKILDFFGYDNTTINDFFNGVGDKKYCPIQLWEYIILRTSLMINTNNVFDANKCTIKLTTNTANNVAKYMIVDSHLIKQLSSIMDKSKIITNVSYLLFDIDWIKLQSSNGTN